MDTLTTLIVTDVACADADIQSLIADLPQTGFHVSVLVTGITAPLPIYAYGAPPYGPMVFPDDWRDDYQKQGENIANRANEIEQLLQKAGLQGDVTTAYCEVSLLDDKVAARACLSDYVFLPHSVTPEAPNFNKIMGGLFFDAPVGVTVNATSIQSVLTAKRPLIAWDRSLQAARAVHRALPVLKQAKEVVICVFDQVTIQGGHSGDPGTDLAAWLSRHGCKVTLHQQPSGGQEISEAILSRSAEMGADLVVMGAYAHSRTRQLLLGGTTQSMLAQADQTVMFAH